MDGNEFSHTLFRKQTSLLIEQIDVPEVTRNCD